jgi:hypothetical protein
VFSTSLPAYSTFSIAQHLRTSYQLQESPRHTLLITCLFTHYTAVPGASIIWTMAWVATFLEKFSRLLSSAALGFAAPGKKATSSSSPYVIPVKAPGSSSRPFRHLPLGSAAPGMRYVCPLGATRSDSHFPVFNITAPSGKCNRLSSNRSSSTSFLKVKFTLHLRDLQISMALFSWN